MYWNHFLRTQTLILPLSVPNDNWDHPPWKNSLHYQYQIVNVPSLNIIPRYHTIQLWKRLCRYLQGTKDNGLVFNPSKKLMVDCYADAYFAELWGHKDPQDPICARSRTGFVVTFSNCPLLWVSKLQTEIALSKLHSDYMALSHYVRVLLPLKILIKEVIDNLGVDSENLKFVSSSTIY